GAALPALRDAADRSSHRRRHLFTGDLGGGQADAPLARSASARHLRRRVGWAARARTCPCPAARPLGRVDGTAGRVRLVVESAVLVRAATGPRKCGTGM